MKPIIDLNKEYGLVFDGGGARGAYQIGAWRALSEAGVKISAVAGTSVGALNGALVCMGDLEKGCRRRKDQEMRKRILPFDIFCIGYEGTGSEY